MVNLVICVYKATLFYSDLYVIATYLWLKIFFYGMPFIMADLIYYGILSCSSALTSCVNLIKVILLSFLFIFVFAFYFCICYTWFL